MKKFLQQLIKLLIACVIIGILIKMDSGGQLFSRLRHIDFRWLIPALILYGIHIFANAWRWHLLLRVRNIRCSLWEAVSLTMQSFFFSLVIPGGAIGGDLVRLAFLTRRVPKEQKWDGGVSILMDRFTGMIGIFSLAILLLPFAARYMTGGSQVMAWLILLLILGSAAGLGGAVFVFFHRKLIRIPFFAWMENFFNHLSRGFYGKVTDAVDSYSDCRGTMMICVVSSILFVNGILGMEAYCIARGLAASPDFMASFSAITIGNIAGLLPLTPSGFGARDFFVLPILKNGGMDGNTALAVTLWISAVILFFNLAGGLFFVFSRHGKAESD